MSRDRRLAACLLLVAASITLSGCDVPKTARCALTNIDAGLRASDAKTLGWAAECALALSPQAIARHVPALLKHLGDTRVFRVVQYGGGLIGFGEAGPRELSVAQVAMRAVESAAATEANIEPIAATLVAALNAIKSTEQLGLYGEPSTTATALVQVFTYQYHPAGLGAAVAAVLGRVLPQVRNAVVTNDAMLMAKLEALARGTLHNAYAGLPTSTTENGITPAPASAPIPAPESAPRPGQHGLTWGLLPAAPGRFAANCHGTPKAPMDQLHRGSCNPYRGDTLCSARLPVLCFAPAKRGLALSQPVDGSNLSARAVADAVCADAFGDEWRMAEHHDGAWGFEGNGAPPSTGTRFWVAISDQPGNCWSR